MIELNLLTLHKISTKPNILRIWNSTERSRVHFKKFSNQNLTKLYCFLFFPFHLDSQSLILFSMKWLKTFAIFYPSSPSFDLSFCFFDFLKRLVKPTHSYNTHTTRLRLISLSLKYKNTYNIDHEENLKINQKDQILLLLKVETEVRNIRWTKIKSSAGLIK